MRDKSIATLRALNESPLWEEASGYAAKFILEVFPKGRRRTPVREFRPQEAYIRDTLLTASAIREACEQLQYAVSCLAGYRSARQPSTTRLEHIHYHLENHTLRVVGLSDRGLQFINAVFFLGLPEKECRGGTVIQNQHVAGTAVGESYKKLEALIKPLRETRNIVMHRRSLRDPAFENVEVFDALAKAGDPEAHQFTFLANEWTNEALKKRKGDLLALNCQLFVAITDLLNAATPVFRERYLSFR